MTAVPIVSRPTGPLADHPSATGAVTVAPALPPGALLPSGTAPTIAPVPAPHRALALDALATLRTLRDHPRGAGPWGEPALAREVDRIRRQLAPIISRRALASSYLREASRAEAVTGPVRLAYTVRWLELGDGTPRAAWSAFVVDGA